MKIKDFKLNVQNLPSTVQPVSKDRGADNVRTRSWLGASQGWVNKFQEVSDIPLLSDLHAYKFIFIPNLITS